MSTKSKIISVENISTKLCAWAKSSCTVLCQSDNCQQNLIVFYFHQVHCSSIWRLELLQLLIVVHFSVKVVTCGNVPLESSFQRVPRCVYTSSCLYEYRGWDSKAANPTHRRFTWGLRSSEVSCQYVKATILICLSSLNSF